MKRASMWRGLTALKKLDLAVSGFGFRSLAVLLEALTYYVASGPEELHRVMGIDWTFGGLGYGYAAAGNGLILSGNPLAAEENRHELVHILLLAGRRDSGSLGDARGNFRDGGSFARGGATVELAMKIDVSFQVSVRGRGNGALKLASAGDDALDLAAHEPVPRHLEEYSG